MNKKETDILTQCVNTMTVMSDKLETMFKTVEVLQKHIMKEGDFEYRIKEIEEIIPAFSKRTAMTNKTVKDNIRRLDRLEECISMINHRLHNHKIDSEITPRTMERLNSIVIDMRDEQAASRGEFDEDK